MEYCLFLFLSLILPLNFDGFMLFFINVGTVLNVVEKVQRKEINRKSALPNYFSQMLQIQNLRRDTVIKK